MPTSAAARGPTVSPSRGPMAPGQTVLVLLVLSTLWVCRAMAAPEPGQWVWGTMEQAEAEPLLLSRSKRDDGKQQPSVTSTTLGHSHAATTMPSSNETHSSDPSLLLGSAPPPAPSTNASLHGAPVVPTTASSLDEADSSEPDVLLGSAPPPASSTNASLHVAPVVPTTASSLDEADSLEPDVLLGSAPAASTTKASLRQGLAMLTTAEQDETESPDLLLSSKPPAAASTTSTSLHRAATPTDPHDEIDSPDPGLLLSSVPPPVPSTQAAPQKSITTSPSQPTLPSKEGMVASGTDNSSVTPSALGPSTHTSKQAKQAESPPAPTHSTPWDTKPGGTTAPFPWHPKGMMGKCLLVMLLLALVAATFMVCTGVLGILLWRRRRRAHHRLSHTEMVCISSLLPDTEVPTNGPRPGPAQRQKLLLDGGSEADGDNLTLSSFLPDHS